QLLALIFGTLLSSQGTDASFVLTLSGFPPGFRSVLAVPAFPTLSDFFASDSRSKRDSLSRHSLSRFPFPAIPTLPDHFHAVSGLELNSVTVGRSSAFRRSATLTLSPRCS
ncbi:hypothetical protein ACFWSF_00005, partial [Streptomyces sp. NPDC058611]|uniref:hypothetical protein n=1 Tax=unclassified Streptomyces TaxID=2593676 RepID=UPI003658AF15